jgi:hypothetical protein
MVPLALLQAVLHAGCESGADTPPFTAAGYDRCRPPAFRTLAGWHGELHKNSACQAPGRMGASILLGVSTVPRDHVGHEYVTHKLSQVVALGADAVLTGPDHTVLKSNGTVEPLCALGAGAGKSQTTRAVARLLRPRAPWRGAFPTSMIFGTTHHCGRAVRKTFDGLPTDAVINSKAASHRAGPTRTPACLQPSRPLCRHHSM